MTLTLIDFVGFVGVALVVGTNLQFSLGRMDVRQPLYPALNGLGSLLIIVSLTQSFNAASFAIESFWLLISLIGLCRIFLLKKK